MPAPTPPVQAKARGRHRADVDGAPEVVEMDGVQHLRTRIRVTDPETGAATLREHCICLAYLPQTSEGVEKILAERAAAFAQEADNVAALGDLPGLAERVRGRLRAAGVADQGTSTAV